MGVKLNVEIVISVRGAPQDEANKFMKLQVSLNFEEGIELKIVILFGA